MVISSMQINTNLFAEAEAVAILARLRAFLAPRGIECYLVGGYLRDGLLGRPSRDIDLAVSGDALSIAREVADAFEAKFVPLDEIHQVARVVLFQNEERWHLDFATMRGSIEDDLGKRDFTIDAIAVKLYQLEAGWDQVALIDPLNGVRDLEQTLIRVASNSAFIDDPARLLRAFRLAAELDFSIDNETEVLIQSDGELITNVSGERVRDELGCILETGRTADSLRHLDRLGLLDLIIPELAASKGVEQPKEHFWNVFDHSLETVAATEHLLVALTREGDLLDSLTFSSDLAKHFSEEIVIGRTRSGLIKLAALLHDVAKPQTKLIDKNGRMRFLGHAKQGASIADSILGRLRFSTKEKRMVTKMIEQHLRPGHLSNASELPTPHAIYRYFRDTADVGIDTLFLSLADHLATRGPALEMESWKEHVEVTQYILSKRFEEEATISPPKLINGHDLIDKFGIAPGPKIGELLEAVREAQASGEINTEEEALAFVREELCAEEIN
ncbi:MAG: metal-dependent phosphohydrolase [Chloroflexi bacterium CG07_land_8_20_14_0_80_51_10]|nr:MAG: metal-dependent phosphohydrolase [Chloroflexi bacterium CG07_land_8_20_14_0_80_51_10]